MSKRMISIVVTVFMLVSIISGCTSESPGTSSEQEASAEQEASTETIKIGAGLALTGGSAEQGNRARRGTLLAIEEANAEGGIDGKLIELVALDDRADPKEAANVANRLAADESVVAVIGHINSSCTLAAAPIYNKNELVHITTCSSSPAISDAGDYTFRVWNSDAYTASFNTYQIIDRGYTKVGIIYENNDYGRGGYEVTVETLAKEGIEPLFAEAYLLGETKDFSTIITKLKNAGVEAVMGIADETEIPLFMKQSHQLGYEPFFASSGTYNPAVIRLGGEDVNGIVGSTFFDPANPPEKVEQFFKKFLDRFSAEGVTGTDPVSPASYDATKMIIQALREKGTTREDVQAYLSDLKDFEGVLGKLSFDENGDTIIPLVKMMIEDGEFKEIK